MTLLMDKITELHVAHLRLLNLYFAVSWHPKFTNFLRRPLTFVRLLLQLRNLQLFTSMKVCCLAPQKSQCS